MANDAGVSGDAGNIWQSARPLGNGPRTFSGSNDPTSTTNFDEDWYSFTVTQTQTIGLSITSSFTQWSPTFGVWLYQTNGEDQNYLGYYAIQGTDIGQAPTLHPGTTYYLQVFAAIQSIWPDVTSIPYTVTISGTATNRPPVASPNSYSTSQNTALNISVPGILGNDTDPDFNPLTAVKASDPSHGTLTLNANGSFSYTPFFNYVGPDSFTYFANDGSVNSASAATVSISVTSVASALPDLVAGTPTLNTTTLQSGGSGLNISYVTTNAGAGTAAASTSKIYLSTDSVITTSDTLLASNSVNSLAASDSFGGGVTNWSIPAVAAGTYWIGVVADANGQVTETNESNNASGAVQITVVAAPKPDLFVVGDHLSSSSASTGASINFSYWVDNFGTSAAPASKTGIYLSTDSTITTADRLLTFANTPAIAAISSTGGTHFNTAAITIPTDVLTGNYFIGAIGDYDSQISESSETNNASVGLPIAVTRVSSPTQNATTLKPGPEGQDVWITNVFTFSDDYGVDDGLLKVGGWGDLYDSLIKFNLSGLTSAAIASATLRLYRLPDSGGATSTGMSIEQVQQSWNENYGWYSYGTRPENGGSVTANPPGLSFKHLSTIGAPGSGWLSVDVTAAVNEWLANPASNNGLLLRPLSTNNNFNMFVSSDAAGSDAQFRPELVITLNGVGSSSAKPHWLASVVIGSHPSGWLPSATGDYNRDGSDDLLWFNSANRNVDLWKIANGGWAGSVDIGAHPPGWQLGASGDFNGDGTSDVLWYNPSSGRVDIWKIANGAWAGSVDVGPHPLGWQPAGSGDFNNDGTSDILWYNATSGNVETWKISNGQWAGSVNIGSHPLGWQPAGTGDFNGDGTSDVLWYNPTTGNVDLWKVANGGWAGSVNMGAHPTGWTPVGVGDFNRDGTSDVAWFNASNGNIEIWLIANGAWSASVNLGNHPLGWSPAGIGDFDHNGVSDILWREASTNRVETWLLTT